jgi:uncharacterized membrane protein YagU involved in acid resistance
MVREGTIANFLSVKAAVVAGLVAGIVFLMVEMLLVPLVGGSPWGPPRMMAAMVMGTEVLPPPASFDLGIMMVAMIIHFVLSIAFAVVLGLIIHRMERGAATIVGLGYGLALYLVNFYLFTAVFPWFANARNWVTVVTHLLFGALAALIYHALAHRGETVRARTQGARVGAPVHG